MAWHNEKDRFKKLLKKLSSSSESSADKVIEEVTGKTTEEFLNDLQETLDTTTQNIQGIDGRVTNLETTPVSGAKVWSGCMIGNEIRMTSTQIQAIAHSLADNPSQYVILDGCPYPISFAYRDAQS